MMLGSWCEGELRSDQPAEGITRVFWHQWRGRFSAFLKHLDQHAVTDWHQTATATDADRIVTVETMPDSKAHENVCIGISAWNVESYDALSEAIQSFGWRTRWVERSNLHNIAGAINAICIDANSLDDNLERRICWLKEQVLDVPIVLSLNFPRANEVSKLRSIGVSSVVSKPFELNDLQLAIVQCLAPGSESTHSVPAPKGLSKPQNTVV